MPLRRYMLDGVGKSVERLSMIAGGTGITPMYQVCITGFGSGKLDFPTEQCLSYNS